MKVNEVIDFLREAKNHTYSCVDKCYLSQAIETLYRMKEGGKFKE